MFKLSDDPLVGRILSGRFEIVAPLGAGGMGRVYRAIQRPLDRAVALKVLQPRFETSDDPSFEKRFLLEASMTAKLKHPNTITIHDYGRTDDGIYFIAMELVEGETLREILQRDGPLPWPRALFMGAQVARSLREAHQLGLVHRDLKPANIMLRIGDDAGGDAVKVLDFGLVKNVPLGPFDETKRPRAEITQARMLIGSPLYIAPEQVRNETDARSDIYSLGVVLYQAIAGRTPFVGDETIDLLVKHLRENPPELRELAEVPFAVNALVMKCLKKRPGDRFQNMDELLAGMRQATAGQDISGVFSDSRGISSIAPGPIALDTPERRAVWPHNLPPAAPAEPDRSRSISIVFDGPPAPRPTRRWIVSIAAAGAVLGLTLGALFLRTVFARNPSNPPAAHLARAKVADAPPRAAPVPKKVVFEITSEPSGASVLQRGEAIGNTPFRLALPREGDAPLRLELALALEGYQSAEFTAQGLEGLVPVHQVLKRRIPAAPLPAQAAPHPMPGRAPKRPLNPGGYKDDPYQ